VKAGKRVYLPVEGDFLTDGTRLVEVIEKCKDGYRVLDALSETNRDERDPREEEIITTHDAVRSWRKVDYSHSEEFDSAA
jgi:hypothetical protein